GRDRSALSRHSHRVRYGPDRPSRLGLNASPRSAGDEVLRLRVMADDGARRLLWVILEAGVLIAFEADALPVEQLEDRLVVLEIGTGRIPPRVASAPVFLAEQPRERRTVLMGEPEFLTDSMVPELAEGLGHLDAETVQHQIFLITVLGEELGRSLGCGAAHRDDLERGVVEFTTVEGPE